jgi:hypothetical protein
MDGIVPITVQSASSTVQLSRVLGPGLLTETVNLIVESAHTCSASLQLFSMST